MNKFFKAVVSTGILSLVLLVLFFVVSFNITNSLNSNDDENMIKLSNKDADVLLASEIIKKYEVFRSSYVDKDKIENLEMIKFIFDNLDKKDYKIKNIEPVKIDCRVNDKIRFMQGGICKVLVVSNKKIEEKRNLVFKYDKEFDFINFKYNGLECKNNGKSYYCLTNKYEKKKQDYKGYSLIDSSYKSDNKIIIYEYYLTDYQTYESCSKYYGVVYCTDDYNGELPPLDKSIIKKYGVYYRHEFIKEEDKLYLDKSFIVNE